MKVNIGHFEFETDEMTAYPTSVASMPTIFVSQNGAAFLQIVRPRWEAAKVRHLARPEALRLADTYRIRGLKEHLLQTSRAVAAAR